MPSELWRCWLGGRKGIRPVKTEWWGAGVVICLERGADLYMTQMMPLPLIDSCFSKIQIGYTILVPAHLDSPGLRAVKRVCVCVCVGTWLIACLAAASVCSISRWMRQNDNIVSFRDFTLSVSSASVTQKHYSQDTTNTLVTLCPRHKVNWHIHTYTHTTV